jgi:hypothetical protein
VAKGFERLDRRVWGEPVANAWEGQLDLPPDSWGGHSRSSSSFFLPFKLSFLASDLRPDTPTLPMEGLDACVNGLEGGRRVIAPDEREKCVWIGAESGADAGVKSKASAALFGQIGAERGAGGAMVS